MSHPQVFTSPTFGQVRTVTVDDEVWFVGKDVAQALGYNNSRKALSDHVDDEDKLHSDGVTIRDSIGREQHPTIINESGLYSLVLSSKLPDAKKFKRWVTAEILPTIRRTGGYQARPMTAYQRETISLQKARLLNQIAADYEGTTYHQVLQAHATKELTGEYLLPLPSLPAKTYSAREVGDILGISAHQVGVLANRHKLKDDVHGQWFKDKSPYGNKEVSTFRYYEATIEVLREVLAETNRKED